MPFTYCMQDKSDVSVPKTEYTILDELKQRSEKLAHPVKKSELPGAGGNALAAMPHS